MKAYFWEPYEDSEGGIAVVAENWREARLIGYTAWGGEHGHDEDWIEQRCKLMRNKDLDLKGLSKGAVKGKEGLRRNLYRWIWDDCDGCGKHLSLTFVYDKCLCGGCEEKEE